MAPAPLFIFAISHQLPFLSTAGLPSLTVLPASPFFIATCDVKLCNNGSDLER